MCAHRSCSLWPLLYQEQWVTLASHYILVYTASRNTQAQNELVGSKERFPLKLDTHNAYVRAYFSSFVLILFSSCDEWNFQFVDIHLTGSFSECRWCVLLTSRCGSSNFPAPLAISASSLIYDAWSALLSLHNVLRGKRLPYSALSWTTYKMWVRVLVALVILEWTVNCECTLNASLERKIDSLLRTSYWASRECQRESP